MTDDELKALVASLAVSQQKTDDKLNKLAKMYGGVGNNQGEAAEEFYYNSLKDKLTLQGIRYDSIDKNVTRKRGDTEDEFDLLLINGKDVFIIEVKYKAHPRDLATLLDKKAHNFRQLFPAYSQHKHHLGLAAFHIHDDLKRQALNQGVTVLQRKGDLVETSP